MQIPALIFRNENPLSPVAIELNLNQSRDLENTRQQSLPVAYLVRGEDLKTLRKFEDALVDRGAKHPSTPLSKRLIGYKKIPLIDWNSDSTRQLGRSIRQLLTHAIEKEDRNVYFIGLKDKLFENLWEDSRIVDTEPLADTVGSRDFRPIDAFPDVSSWLVQELFHHCQIPHVLTERYVGVSQDAMLVRQLIVLAARAENPVLILGNTGTGKEVVAREIHANSSRRNKGFLSINCGGIPSTLIESELFGHLKGAFTDAKHTKEGLWKLAGEGTLFLDEIGDLHIESQAKILRALEDGYMRPVGGEKQITVHARVLAATNRDLFAMVWRGAFREDLYYRLRGFLIRTPALRSHTEDIPVLAEFFWKRINKDNYKPLPQDVIDRLKSYSWPGNVREIKWVLENLYSLFGGFDLHTDHLDAVFYLEGQEIPARSASRKSEYVGIKKKNLEQIASRLHHLTRSQEVIRSLELGVDKMKGRNEQSLNIAFKFGVYELESLCRQPSLLGDAFSAVWGLLETMNRFQERIQIEEKGSGEWSLKLAENFSMVQGVLSDEVKKTLKYLNPQK